MNGKVYDDLLSRFWTQGFTNSDAPAFGSNVWSWDVTNQQWTTLANQETGELATGTGFLTYMYTDDDNNGTDDGFPKTLSAPGSFTSLNNYDAIVNTGVQYIFNDLDDTDFYLAANPYSKAIDWDAGSGWTKTNLSETIYIWSDSASTWLTWNGVTGSKPNDGVLDGGQAFFVQASGGTGTLYTQETVQTDNNSFYLKSKSDQPFVSIRLDADAENLSSSAFITFTEQGLTTRDPLDGLALNPFSEDFLQLGFEEVTSNDVLSIQSLPLISGQRFTLPLSLTGRNVSDNATFTLSEMQNVQADWSFYLLDVESGKQIEISPNSPVDLTVDTFKQPVNSFASGNMVTNLKGKGITSRYHLIIETGTVSSENPTDDTPKNFELNQNYPNPFNPSTVIGYAIPEQTSVSITVYDMLGRVVATLINNKTHEAGEYEVQFDAAGLSSGAYIYQLTAGNMVLTKKLMLIK
ncbi:MAG: T9SS type A sorting domain-containing protein [Balneolaceae bacterium]|nr:T9SS type A sorting domain-containing protein [Balneolaceae bacterium]